MDQVVCGLLRCAKFVLVCGIWCVNEEVVLPSPAAWLGSSEISRSNWPLVRKLATAMCPGMERSRRRRPGGAKASGGPAVNATFNSAP